MALGVATMALGACGHDQDQAVHGSGVPGAKAAHLLFSSRRSSSICISPAPPTAEVPPRPRADTTWGEHHTRAGDHREVAVHGSDDAPLRSTYSQPGTAAGSITWRSAPKSWRAPPVCPHSSSIEVGAACLSVGRGGVLVSWAGRRACQLGGPHPAPAVCARTSPSRGRSAPWPPWWWRWRRRSPG
jgi:hypothetical protein